jgi:hypothetical protein
MEFLDISLTKELESFAPCDSQSLILQDFKENHTLLWFKNPNKKISKEKNSSLFMNCNEGRKPNKNSSLRRLEFTLRNLA